MLSRGAALVMSQTMRSDPHRRHAQGFGQGPVGDADDEIGHEPEPTEVADAPSPGDETSTWQ